MRAPDYDKLSEIVFQVLFESGINELPINMVGLCQSRGIKIKYLPDEDMREGCCQVHEGKPYIFIKRNGLRRRKRFTVAHELGHIMLGHIEACKTEEIERSVFSAVEEREANAFAERLLAPLCILEALGVTEAEQIMHLCDVSRAVANRRLRYLQSWYQWWNELDFTAERHRLVAQFRGYIRMIKGYY